MCYIYHCLYGTRDAYKSTSSVSDYLYSGYEGASKDISVREQAIAI